MLERVDGAVVDGVVLGDQTGEVYRFAERRHRIVPHSRVITYALRAFDEKRGKCLQIGRVAAQANDGQVFCGSIHWQEYLRRVLVFLQQSYLERQLGSAATKHTHVETRIGAPILDISQMVEALCSAHVRRLERQALVGTNYGAVAFVRQTSQFYRLHDFSSGGGGEGTGCGSRVSGGAGAVEVSSVAVDVFFAAVDISSLV